MSKEVNQHFGEFQMMWLTSETFRKEWDKIFRDGEEAVARGESIQEIGKYADYVTKKVMTEGSEEAKMVLREQVRKANLEEMSVSAFCNVALANPLLAETIMCKIRKVQAEKFGYGLYIGAILGFVLGGAIDTFLIEPFYR